MATIKSKLLKCGKYSDTIHIKVKDETTGAPSYKLITQSDGTTTAKTPLGCFDDMLIDNDMDYIVKKIDEYNTGE